MIPCNNLIIRKLQDSLLYRRMKAPMYFPLRNKFLIDILQWCARAICHPTNQPVIRHRKQQRHLLIYRRTTSATSNHQRRGNVRITQICRKKDKEFINASHAMTSKWLEPIMVPRSWCTFFAQTLGSAKVMRIGLLLVSKSRYCGVYVKISMLFVLRRCRLYIPSNCFHCAITDEWFFKILSTLADRLSDPSTFWIILCGKKSRDLIYSEIRIQSI